MKLRPEDIQEGSLYFIDSDTYEMAAEMQLRERKRRNQAAYVQRKKELNQAYDTRVRHDHRDQRPNHHKGTKPVKMVRPENKVREFIAWDGEGPRDAGYALFGNSVGMEICHRNLGTEECLDLILNAGETYPYAIHVIYGGKYDASMILNDLDHRRLNMLQKHGTCYWHGYDIEYIPGKWFTVSKNGIRVKMYDIVSFFATGYVQALKKQDIGTVAEIDLLTSEKARRGEFLWSEIEEIRDYWLLELRLMPQLANKLRTLFLDSGYDLKAWHGPGALAREALKKHKVKDAMAEPPVEVRVARRYAFAGGRFEMVRGGRINMRIYNADINSAYPYYMTMLPNLAKGSWRQTKKFEPGKFAVYEIEYNDPVHDPMKIYPLFRRMKDGTVIWTHKVYGWYWAPEAELVTDDPHAKILSGWVFDEENVNDRPFAWLNEYYDRRNRLKNMGNALEYTYKLIINSVYGQTAQRSGWNKLKKLAPPYHQLEWAGFTTSGCRAAIYKAAKSCGDKLVSIDTDGIYSMCPIEGLDEGTKLGQWGIEEFDGGIFWQSGIYCLYDSTEKDWVKGKSRGIPKGKTPCTVVEGSQCDHGQCQAYYLQQALDNGGSFSLIRNSFIGFGAALNRDLDQKNTWVKEPVIFEFGGHGKRYHNTRLCERGTQCHDGIHHFVAMPILLMRDRLEPGFAHNKMPVDNMMSEPHYIPWMENDPLVASKKNIIDSETMVHIHDDMDEDDEWEFELLKELGERV